jgi:hypothetical protein
MGGQRRGLKIAPGEIRYKPLGLRPKCVIAVWCSAMAAWPSPHTSLWASRPRFRATPLTSVKLRGPASVQHALHRTRELGLQKCGGPWVLKRWGRWAQEDGRGSSFALACKSFHAA